MMHTSHFRFDQVHQFRRSVREQRRLELLEVQRAEDQLACQIAQLHDELQSIRSQARSVVRPGQLDLSQLRHAQRYEQSLRSELSQAQRRCQTLAAEVEHRRQALVAAEQEVKLLDRLQEQQRVRRRLDLARREAKLHDELAMVANFARIDS
ncbi:MAG: flagellar export protein FliJ [Pirellulales bacterium]|nr:flagellar export protein FliJ [Pirellulales bacterium]